MRTRIMKIALLAIVSFGATAASAESLANWPPTTTTVSSQPSANQRAVYGYVVTDAAARTVSIDSTSRFLNVTRLETVKINVDGKSVTWKFDTLGTQPFQLASIIPEARNVTVYVTESPYYLR